jgi:GT2 family glycosyltransferase
VEHWRADGAVIDGTGVNTVHVAAPVRRGSLVSTAPLVSVLVPVLFDPTLAIGCLDSLPGASRTCAIEAVVVANGTPGEARRSLERREDIVLVTSGTNLGFAGGNNLAADVARGQYLLLLNDDSKLEDGCIDQLVATAERDRSIGAVGGRILSADGSLQEAGSVLWNDGWAVHVGSGLPPDTRAFDYLRDVDYVSANGLLVRRSAWSAVGGLDQGYYPAYYEDVDLCMALRRHGCRVVYEPRARLRHLESQSTSTRYRNFLVARHRERFVAKWGEELSRLDDRPEALDEAAVDHAVQRARGSPPRVLVEGNAGLPASGRWFWEVVEELAGDGWAVTATSPPEEDLSGYRPDRASLRDRLADAGVDRRFAHTDEVLSTAGADFEAMVIGADAGGPRPPLVRPDGSELPVVRALSGPDADLAQSVGQAVTEAARRTPAPRRR